MSKKILVIDDDKAIRELLIDIFSREGYEVLSAENGLEGLEIFENSHVDLVITDIIMPDKEGLETIMEMKRKRSDIKIVAISGGGRGSAKDYLTMAKGFGATAVLSKPFDRNELLDIVTKLFS